MSSDAIAITETPSPAAAALVANRKALRIGFGVALGFALGEWSGTTFFFFPPLMAAQFLATMHQPPSLRQGLGIVVLTVLSAGLTLIVVSTFAGQPLAYLLLVSLLLFYGFLLDTAGKALPATLLLTLAATVPLIAPQSLESARMLAWAVIEAHALGIVAAWIMFAVFPAPATVADLAPPTRPASPRTALTNLLILLPVLSLFLVTSRMTFVVLMVIVGIIRLRDRSGAPRAALGLLLGNILGGVVATIVYAFLSVQTGMIFFLLVVLLVGLIFGGQIAKNTTRAPIYIVALATFVILLGLGVSPLPMDSGEAFTSRLWNVLLAGAYAVGAISLVAIRRPDSPVHSEP
jgi:hypothetical protein